MFDRLNNGSVPIYTNQTVADANQLRDLFPTVGDPKADEVAAGVDGVHSIYWGHVSVA